MGHEISYHELKVLCGQLQTDLDESREQVRNLTQKCKELQKAQGDRIDLRPKVQSR